MYVNYFIYIYLEVNIYIQSTRITLPLWTFAHSCVASTSNPPRFLAPFGPLPASPQLQRPIQHAFLLLLDFYHASPQLQRPIHHDFLLLLDFLRAPRCVNVQSTTLSCSFWTSAMPPAASTSNPPRFLSHFGLLPASPPPKSPIHHASNPRLPSHKLPTTQKSNTSTSVPALLYIF